MRARISVLAAAFIAAAALLPTEEFLKRLADPVSGSRAPALAPAD